MTVPREDTEPEEARARAAPADWRTDPSFRWPEKVPWSVLGPDFIAMWGRDQPEHWEITGPTGSGKTRLLMHALQDRYRIRKTGAIFIISKHDDDIFAKMGWPVAHSAGEVRDTNVLFWPRTKKTGLERRDFLEQRIRSLLEKLWEKGPDRVLAFDEIGYVENLSGEMKALVQQYWRESRSLGINMAAMKQRPQGALRDMHSESAWTAVFKPKDRSDAERFAELLGHRRDWLPVLDSLDMENHEFVLRHTRSKEAYISWVDTELHPQKIKRKGLGALVSR